MILNVEPSQFNYYLPIDPNPFVSESFLKLNEGKADKIVRLIQDTDKVQMGLMAGVKDGILLSPFSAPFGGFHFKHDNVYPAAIESFMIDLMAYAELEKWNNIHVTLPPDIYSHSFNSKVANTFIRLGFKMQTPDITNWVDLTQFQEAFTHGATRTYYNQAVKNKLAFCLVNDVNEMELVYNLIVENRARVGRPIFMTFNDLQEAGKLFATDYFKVINPAGEMLAAAIFYRINSKISFAVFWGDAMEGRPARAMDFLVFQLWCFYKKAGFQFIDLGKSTESGVPNEGLLRFKETHECITSLRFSFTWK